MMVVWMEETTLFCQGWEKDDGLLKSQTPGKPGVLTVSERLASLALP